MQTLENEVNLKTKNEIDTNYLKSLRYSVSLSLSLFKHYYLFISNILILILYSYKERNSTQKAPASVKISTDAAKDL